MRIRAWIRVFAVVLAACGIALIVQVSMSFSAAAHQIKFKVLLVTKTNESHHASVNAGVSAIKKLADRNRFDVMVYSDSISLTDTFLAQFQAVIFLCTKDNIWAPSQKEVLERFIKSGKGYVGIHSASATEYEWAWYTQLVGRMFYIHPVIQKAELKVLDDDFPGLRGFAERKSWMDEWYEFGPEKVSGLHYILGVDESTYDPKADWGTQKGNGMGKFHPIAWYHHYDGGRSFYTALGHVPTNYKEPAFLNHLYAGIFWAATGDKLTDRD